MADISAPDALGQGHEPVTGATAAVTDGALGRHSPLLYSLLYLIGRALVVLGELDRIGAGSISPGLAAALLSHLAIDTHGAAALIWVTPQSSRSLRMAALSRAEMMTP